MSLISGSERDRRDAERRRAAARRRKAEQKKRSSAARQKRKRSGRRDGGGLIKVILIAAVCLLLAGAASAGGYLIWHDKGAGAGEELSEYSELEFSGRPYVDVNEGVPFFEEDDYTTDSYDKYYRLDRYGRARGAMACLGTDLMPVEERGDISSVEPSGWQSAEYDFIEQGHLYNRCHLIAFMLTGQNANEKNLITGTRYMNTRGMLPFESEIADYIMTTGNHVMYRVRPVYRESNQVASGVLMEAYSVEDEGAGVCFNIYCFNVQPGVKIDYSDGSSHADGTVTESETSGGSSGWSGFSRDEEIAKVSGLASEDGTDYVLNLRRHKIHFPECSSVGEMSEENRYEIRAGKNALKDAGYDECGSCRP